MGNESDTMINGQEQEDDRVSDSRLIQLLSETFAGPHTVGSSTRFWIVFALGVVYVLVYPFVTNPYRVLVTTGFFVWIFLALSLSVIWGYTGIFSFGQIAFFGLGGYTYGVVSINIINMTGATNIALLAGLVVPAIIAAVVGYFIFYGRVSGVYVAIITLSVTLILELLFSRTAGPQYTIGNAHLGGYNGMTDIPSLTFGYGSFSFEFEGIPLYYFVVIVVLLLFFALRYFVNSNYGYVMVAIREDEDRTEMFGYDIRLVKLQVFTLSGAIAGLGGVLYAAQGNFISPPIMGLTFAALPVIWVIVGGRKTLLGALIGTVGLRYLNDSLSTSASQFSFIILGLILLVVVLYFPEGVIPTIKERIENGVGSIPLLGGEN